MRECALCGIDCGPAIGMARELKTTYWGGSKGKQTVDYTAQIVTFFCSDEHRSLYLLAPVPGTGEIQTNRWGKNGED